ncbi:carbohydrate kinase family protein [Patescibacteria group bacterium]|nr:carbohydrate kinase family protein [Patescibacteria group bacterium]
MYNIIAIGDALIDTHVKIDNASVHCNLDGKNCKLCMDYASKIPITESFQSLGGNGANMAVGSSKLGLNTAIVASLGKDSNAEIIMDEMKKLNIDTGMISRDGRAKTRYSIVLNFQGERTILSYHQKRKYVWPKNMPATDWIYFTGLSEGFEVLQDQLMGYLAKHPTVRMAYNPGSFQLKHAMNRVHEAAEKADVLIVNLEEAEQILGTTIKKEKTAMALIHELLTEGVKEVVITDGQHGAWAGNDEEIWYMEPYPVQVVAKTGAGDAFSSGYVSAKCLGHGIKEALTWGTANSCGVIQEFGAQKGLLDQKTIKKIAKQYPPITARRV